MGSEGAGRMLKPRDHSHRLVILSGAKNLAQRATTAAVCHGVLLSASPVERLPRQCPCWQSRRAGTRPAPTCATSTQRPLVTSCTFTDDANLRTTTEQIADLRQRALISYGSCSFTEPREDLQSLGYL